jgi:hypothetical protein
MSDRIWDIDAQIKMQLMNGVDFGDGRRLAVLIEPDVSWVKLYDDKTITAVYIKNMVKVTVVAQLRDDGSVEIISASLDILCRGAP